VNNSKTYFRRPGTRPAWAFALLLLLAVIAGGCRSIGPGTIKRDRLHYSSAVAESFKEQLLLNIVKTRYGDAPAFLEVSSLVSGYSLETGVSVNGEFSPENLRGDTFVGGELSGKYTDRPTISYAPMTGERFARSLLSPVSVDALMFVIQGGAPADFIIGLSVQSFEGHHNEGIYGGQFEPGDAAFGRLLQLMRALQQARVIEPEVVKQQERTEVWLHFRAPAANRTNLVQSLAELKSLLGVAPEKDRARVVFGMSSPEPGVIAIRTRSLMQILSTLGAGVEVPAEHLSSGGAVPAGAGPNLRRLIVHSGLKKPAAAFVSVPYEGRWFWVEQNDLASKTTLSFVTVLFSFLDSSGKQSSPVLTIPTN
jgi:hypothetical protein